jgi:hypothetical protein
VMTASIYHLERPLPRRHAEQRSDVIKLVLNNAPSTALVRPGFSVLLDSLAHPSAYGLVIPAVYHLSWKPEVRAILEQRIREVGAVVWVVEGESWSVRRW